jgi:putative membrane protein
MRHARILLSIAIGITLITSCGNGGSTDAKERADSANTAKIDNAKARDTSAAQPVHMADLKQDAAFAVAAADGGMLEVALGKLAVKQGTSTAVKKLGAQMVKDHSKANMELKALAGEKHITIPATMSEKCQKEISDLESKTGEDFNKAYADLMVKDHKDDIDEFKKEAKDGNDAQVSSWAKNKIPVLEHHLMMAEDVQKQLEK